MRSRALGVGTIAVAAIAIAASGAATRVLPVRISSDPLAGDAPGQHATEVEPDSFAAGRTVVAVFQVGRNVGGGAAAIGFSTSRDAGRTWRDGLLPGVTRSSPPPAAEGTSASDPAVGYDAAHRTWLVSTLSGFGGHAVVLVSRSADALSWDAPVVARAATPFTLDKEWIACDNWPRSRFRGRCYLAYAEFEHPGGQGSARLAVQTSADGGATWTEPEPIPVNYEVETDTLSPYLVVRPSGELVVVVPERNVLEAVRSPDGGRSFGRRETIAPMRMHVFSYGHDRLRAPPIPVADVDAAGRVYVAWYDCRRRPRCRANDIVLSTSPRRGVWTAPRRVPFAPAQGTIDAALPALAVDHRTSGRRARLAVSSYTLTTPDCTGAACRLRFRLMTSANGGRSWRTVSVAAPAMQLDWLAETGLGRMVGDYTSVSFAESRAIAVFALARPPHEGRLDEGIFAVAARVR